MIHYLPSACPNPTLSKDISWTGKMKWSHNSAWLFIPLKKHTHTLSHFFINKSIVLGFVQQTLKLIHIRIQSGLLQRQLDYWDCSSMFLSCVLLFFSHTISVAHGYSHVHCIETRIWLYGRISTALWKTCKHTKFQSLYIIFCWNSTQLLCLPFNKYEHRCSCKSKISAHLTRFQHSAHGCHGQRTAEGLLHSKNPQR